MARRVEPVIDAWFDSGSMPAAQVGYPHAEGSAEAFIFPADFISEAIDQTRGWFYSLLAVNVLVFGESPYRHVVCLGHIVDADGRKMSKSHRQHHRSLEDPGHPRRRRHAVVDVQPGVAVDAHPSVAGRHRHRHARHVADVVEHLQLLLDVRVAERVRSRRSRRSRSRPSGGHSTAGSCPAWPTTTADVTDALRGYEPLDAASALGTLVDDLSNWYVRRSRRRFWRTDPDAPPSDTLAAQATLHTVLRTFSLLLAPMCPFVSDTLWRHLTGAEESDSVHLADWPAGADGHWWTASSRRRWRSPVGSRPSAGPHAARPA